jgi:hypothetical protein
VQGNKYYGVGLLSLEHIFATYDESLVEYDSELKEISRHKLPQELLEKAVESANELIPVAGGVLSYKMLDTGVAVWLMEE